MILGSPTFVTVNRVLLDDHRPPIESRHLLRLPTIIAHIGVLLPIHRARVDRYPQYMAP
jgi:hypothetical protein